LKKIAAVHSDWVLGFEDETWWSRLLQPKLHAWTDGEPLRLYQLEKSKADLDPKALCCYGLLRCDTDKLMLQFVEGRPVSQVTTDFLEWVCGKLAEEGKRVLALIWDNATWHKSQKVHRWIKQQNKRAKQEGGVRILVMRLPIKSPWLNPIEPHWVHGKRAVVEPERKLTAEELINRVCEYFRCEHYEHLKQNLS
jgi:transposase